MNAPINATTPDPSPGSDTTSQAPAQHMFSDAADGRDCARAVSFDARGVPQYQRPRALGDHLPEVEQAFWAYETALMADDLDAMAELFAPGEQTLRGDASGLLISHDAITGFRGNRGGAPARRIVELHLRSLGPDHACTVAITQRLDSEGAGTSRGQQTQIWTRSVIAESEPAPVQWTCSVAHVMLAAPAIDRRIWRVIGEPLIPAAAPARSQGPLAGHTVAVKDLFAVAGQRIGAGSPAYLAEAEPQQHHAAAVAALLAAGADITGVAATDEFAYSLAGTNSHYGTPPNPHAPHRISGGSSSGSASAVALGQVSIGLGTDTGGSIRVPSAYQGLWGIRTTHGLVPRTGLLPLAPSFDTIGAMTRTPQLLAAVVEEISPHTERHDLGELRLIPELVELADPEVTETLYAQLGGVAALETGLDAATLSSWLQAFSVIQGREAWAEHGQWVSAHEHQMAPDVLARFRRAASFSAEDEAKARDLAAEVRKMVRDWVGDGVLALPSASSAAPLLRDAALGGEVIETQRQRTLTLTCLAGLAGLPVVNIPYYGAADDHQPGLPVGLSLVGPAGTDAALIRYAAAFTEAAR